MHIWLFSPFSPLPAPGTPESRTATLARVLADQGHTVTWFASDWDHRQKRFRKESVFEEFENWINGQLVNDAPCSTPHLSRRSPWAKTDAPCQIKLIPTPPYTKNISLRRFLSHRTWGTRLVRIARQKVAAGELSPPDLILASSPPLDAPHAAFQLQKQFGCKVYIDLTDLWPHTFERMFRVPRLRGILKGRFTDRVAEPPVPNPKEQKTSQFLHPLYRKAQTHWRNADGISAMSQEYLDEVLKIAPEQTTHLCYIGGSLPPFDVQRSTLEVQRSPLSFLYLGALTSSYDFDTLFAAAKILIKEGHEFHIHIAGSGPLEEKLNELASEIPHCGTEQLNHPTTQPLNQHLSFHGFLDEPDMQALLADCHVGLNIIRPGLHITMPHKLNDYLCAGLPVINSLQGEAEDLLTRYQAGTTYTAGDPESLANTMRIYLEKSGHKKTPQNGARKCAAELLDREITYPEWARWLASS